VNTNGEIMTNKIKNVIAFGLLALSLHVQSLPCDTEYGVCLDGKRSDFVPNYDDLRVENCDGYPNFLFICNAHSQDANNPNHVRVFDWTFWPARAYKPDTQLLHSDGQMWIESEFTFVEGDFEISWFQQTSDTYTIDLSVDFNYDGYNDFYMSNLGWDYSAKIEVALVCDGEVMGDNRQAYEIWPGDFGGGDTARRFIDASFKEFNSRQCQHSLGAQVYYEGQKFKLNKLSLTILQEN